MSTQDIEKKVLTQREKESKIAQNITGGVAVNKPKGCWVYRCPVCGSYFHTDKCPKCGWKRVSR